MTWQVMFNVSGARLRFPLLMMLSGVTFVTVEITGNREGGREDE